MSPRLRFLGALLVLAAAHLQPAHALEIVGLAADGQLLSFDSAKPRIAKRVRVTGTEARLVGIDVRPADGALYAVDEKGTIYTISPADGAARVVARLARGFEAGAKSIVDFNPQADRLRLINLAGTSYRVVTNTGEVVVDGALRFADGDRNAGKAPTITTGAYTNSFAGARGTELFDIDTALDVLVLQSPPNDGVLQTRGKLGVDFSPTSAFDITPTADGDNLALAVSNRVLYRIDLVSGRAKRIAPIAGLKVDLIDIAIVHAKR